MHADEGSWKTKEGAQRNRNNDDKQTKRATIFLQTLEPRPQHGRKYVETQHRRKYVETQRGLAQKEEGTLPISLLRGLFPNHYDPISNFELDIFTD